MPPKVLAKNNERPSGVLPVSGAARAATSKAPAARLKLEIRRLPPSLTLSEFEEILGAEWRLGEGKVDWREYRQGKIKSAIGKVPEQSRCYVHLRSEALVKEFEARFLHVVFHDKAGTHRSPDLRHLPPTLGFAPNQRTPLNVKVKVDNRQGTIDQDPEFIRFLEAETQPILKPAALDALGVEKEKVEKVETTSTPLIDAIREKKANKAKAAAAKEEKREAKGHTKSDSKEVAVAEKTSKDVKITASKKAEPPPKEHVKALNKPIAEKQQQQRPASPQQTQPKPQPSPARSKKAASNSKPQDVETAPSAAVTTPTPAAPSPSQRGQRQRGNPETIKKLFQKDLGLKPKQPAPTKDVPPQATKVNRPETTEKQAPAPASAKPSPAPTPAKPAQQPPQTKAAPPSKPQAIPKQQTQPATATSTFKAYLKHANPSQGMTEVLIKQALATFGEIASVSIDPRKGTAIAIFKDAEGLKKAIETRKVPVANGVVEVLEYRDRNAPASSVRGGSRGGRGGARAGRGAMPAVAATQADSTDVAK